MALPTSVSGRSSSCPSSWSSSLSWRKSSHNFHFWHSGGGRKHPPLHKRADVRQTERDGANWPSDTDLRDLLPSYASWRSISSPPLTFSHRYQTRFQPTMSALLLSCCSLSFGYLPDEFTDDTIPPFTPPPSPMRPTCGANWSLILITTAITGHEIFNPTPPTPPRHYD